MKLDKKMRVEELMEKLATLSVEDKALVENFIRAIRRDQLTEDKDIEWCLRQISSWS